MEVEKLRINAYVLAADPAWIEKSVKSYYGLVDRIVVSYDEDSLGWTGAPIDVEQCLRRLRAIDQGQKMVFVPGSYSKNGDSPMVRDTRQRQAAFDVASEGADWVLQFDTDEVLPQPQLLLEILVKAHAAGFNAVEWPMRVLFRRVSENRFLEVCARNGEDRFEYPGPIAVRPGAQFVDARRAKGDYLRLVVRGDHRSLQITQANQNGETRWECLGQESAIVHNSWGRDAASIRSKIASWGHHEGWKTWMFYYLRWKPAPWLWFLTKNFHPFHPPLWPALKPREITLSDRGN